MRTRWSARYVSISAGMVPGQQMITDPVVRIGDRCMIGRGSHIVGHFDLEIGDDVHTGPYVYITDQNHGYADPDSVVHAQWPSDVPVHIGDGQLAGNRASWCYLGRDSAATWSWVRAPSSVARFPITACWPVSPPGSFVVTCPGRDGSTDRALRRPGRPPPGVRSAGPLAETGASSGVAAT